MQLKDLNELFVLLCESYNFTLERGYLLVFLLRLIDLCPLKAPVVDLSLIVISREAPIA